MPSARCGLVILGLAVAARAALAQMAAQTIALNPQAAPLGDQQRDLHFLRKHGPQASYGQKS